MVGNREDLDMTLSNKQKETLDNIIETVQTEADIVKLDYENNLTDMDSGSVVVVHQNSPLLEDEDEPLFYIIFFLIGLNLGVLLMYLITSSKTIDLKDEIADLRVVRGLLKNELIKKQTKPTPRKYRKKKIRGIDYE